MKLNASHRTALERLGDDERRRLIGLGHIVPQNRFFDEEPDPTLGGALYVERNWPVLTLDPRDVRPRVRSVASIRFDQPPKVVNK